MMKQWLYIVLFAVLFAMLLVGCTNIPSSVPTQEVTVDAKTGVPMSAAVAMTLTPRSAPATPTRFVATEDVSMIQPMILTAVPTIYARLTERVNSPEQSGSLDDVAFDVPADWFVSEQGGKSVLIEPKVADGKTFIRLELVEDQFEISQLIGDRLLSYDQVIPIVEDVNNPSLQVRRLALVDLVLVLMNGETLASEGNTYRQLYRDVYDSLRLSD